MRATLVALTLLVPAAPVPARGDITWPRGRAPLVLAAEFDGADGPSLHVLVTEVRREVQAYTAEVGGRLEVRQRTALVPVTRVVRLPLGDDVRVFRLDGTRVEPRDVPKLLPRRAPLLVSADGREVDPFYLRLARKGTLVVVSPKVPGVTPPDPVPTRKTP